MQKSEEKVMQQEYVKLFEGYYEVEGTSNLKFDKVNEQLGSIEVLLEEIKTLLPHKSQM
jgi:hypothetical protein